MAAEANASFIQPDDGEVTTPAQKKILEELKLKDLKVKNYLFQSIDKLTLKIMLQKDTSKQIWESMKIKFQGNARVKRAQLQALRREFEVLEMKVGESVSNYFSQVMTVANNMRNYREDMSDVKKFRKKDGREHALKVSSEERPAVWGRGKSTFRGRGRGRGKQSFNRATVECYRCHKLGHFQYECPSWDKEANYAEFDENEELLLMAYVEMNNAKRE
eukprot:XP_015570725.1 uncharacterized protein LOC107260781 [Ricinus communis]